VRAAAALLLAAAWIGVPGAAAAQDAKDPEFPRRLAAMKKAAFSLPEAAKEPMAPKGERFLSAHQWKDREAAREAETQAALAAVRALAESPDSRVFEELARGLGVCRRMLASAEPPLAEAVDRLDKKREPWFEKREEEFRRTGSWPSTVLVAEKQAIDTLLWIQQEAAHAVDFALRVRDALVEGLSRNLEVLGDRREAAWKAAVKLGTAAADPFDRAAFCLAAQGIPGPEADRTLLEIEAKEKDPAVLGACIEALAARRCAAAFPRLLARLDDPDLGVVIAAVRGMTRFRSAETVPALAARLARAPEGRVRADLLEALFALTGKVIADDPGAWESWWRREGEKFLRRWDPDPAVRLDEVEAIGLTDERLINVPAELSALLPAETDPKVREAILENLTIHRSDAVRLTLLRCLYDPSKSTRIAAIRGLSAYRHVSVPEELMRLALRADAEELQAIHQTLRTLWGGAGQFGVDAPERDKLLRWWDTSRDRVAEHFGRLGASEVASGRQPSPADESRWKDRNFYGLRVESDRVLFVVDVSLSMEEPAKRPGRKGTATGDPEPGEDGKPLRKIEVAKNELRRVLRGLPEGTRFGLVLFSFRPEVWDQGLVKMDGEVRKKAIAWVDALRTREATNVYDALEEAFRIGTEKSPLRAAGPPDTIYFVSDGAPTVGKFLQPDLIREHVRRWNRGRNLKIHVVGVGDDHDVLFCRNLAEENGGYYVAR
jgi:hypothetical protein